MTCLVRTLIISRLLDLCSTLKVIFSLLVSALMSCLPLIPPMSIHATDPVVEPILETDPDVSPNKTSYILELVINIK